MKSFIRMALLAFSAALPALAQAEDIDLFVGTPPSGAEAPNVLIILDNTGNWSTPFENQIAALSSVVGALPPDRFRLGLMLFSETGGNDAGNSGAYVRAAIRPLTAGNKVLMQNLVLSLDKNADKGNAGKAGKAMWEAYLYFAGLAPHAGNQKAKTDYTGNRGINAASDAIYALAGNALASKAGTRYNRPVVSGCAKNYIIYISNGAAQDSSNDITEATAALLALGGATTPIPLSPSGSQINVADEWARFMKQSPEAITTYTLDINKVTSGQGPGWTALLQSMARVSSGKYFDVAASGTQIADALGVIFSEIQGTNTAFASVSLPVSVNTQGTYLNQVFIGMFRPDEDAYPRWFGNLKQYKLGRDGTNLRLFDAADRPAINTSTGFVSECARSFWTPATVDSYWAFRPVQTCLTVPGSDASNSPDGNIVEKGAQAHRLRSATSRSMFTCSGNCAGGLSAFNTGNTAITQAALGAASASERNDLINWTRGQDLKDENGNGLTSDMRPSVHGDVVHSRPVALNYGSATSPQVVVFYGANDGALRAVNGNRSSMFGTAAAGDELWSFIPPEFHGSLKRLYDNNVLVKYPGQAGLNPTPLPKPYGMDGAVAAYKDGNTAWIYASMRRGGRALYAFDVSAPGSPTLKWKRGCPNNFPASGTVSDSDCSSGLSGIGQTWSTPKLFQAAGYGSGSSPLLVVGGGYDTCEDADPHACGSSTKGNKLYVFDADSGALVRSFDTDRSVVADVTLVPGANGTSIYGYTADLGGNVYRLNIGSGVPSTWTLTKVAALGCATGGTCAANRKFMFAPDVVADGAGYVLLIGSGDREKPLASYTRATATTNYFFMLKDQPGNSTWLSSESERCSGSALCLNSLHAIAGSSTPSDAELAAKKGWYLSLSPTEQVVTSALTVFGVVTFSTHQPAVATAGVCTSLGDARVYNINYLNAEGIDGPRYADLTGDGLPPSPVAGMVTLDDGSTEPFVIGANPESALDDGRQRRQSSILQPTTRVYWSVEE